MHLYQLCYNARRMDRHSEAELWARFKAVRPQDACAVTPARPALHPTPEQIDAALEWAREYLLTRQVIGGNKGVEKHTNRENDHDKPEHQPDHRPRRTGSC